MKLLELPPALRMRRQFGVFDDFLWFVTAHLWTSLAADSGASAGVGDAAGGILALVTGGTNNNEASVKSTNELFLLAAEKPLLYEARLQFSEANTDDANVAVGFANAWGADLLVDDGAGPKSSFSGALIYKVDGGTKWCFRTSVGTSYVDTVSQHTAGGSSYQTLRIEIRQATAGASGLEAVPFIDGQQMLDANGKPIKHALTYTSATEMNAGAYVKAGGANSETLNVDYIDADALR